MVSAWALWSMGRYIAESKGSAPNSGIWLSNPAEPHAAAVNADVSSPMLPITVCWKRPLTPAKQGSGSAKNISSLTIEEVTAIARKGEPALQKIFKRGGEILGLGISGLVQIFNPEKIIIAGEGVEQERFCSNPCKK